MRFPSSWRLKEETDKKAVLLDKQFPVFRARFLLETGKTVQKWLYLLTQTFEGIDLNWYAIPTLKHFLRSSGHDWFEAINRVRGMHIWLTEDQPRKESLGSPYHLKGQTLLGETNRTADIVIVLICISLLIKEVKPLYIHFLTPWVSSFIKYLLIALVFSVPSLLLLHRRKLTVKKNQMTCRRSDNFHKIIETMLYIIWCLTQDRHPRLACWTEFTYF